jgi:hypothetical protein
MTQLKVPVDRNLDLRIHTSAIAGRRSFMTIPTPANPTNTHSLLRTGLVSGFTELLTASTIKGFVMGMRAAMFPHVGEQNSPRIHISSRCACRRRTALLVNMFGMTFPGFNSRIETAPSTVRGFARRCLLHPKARRGQAESCLGLRRPHRP